MALSCCIHGASGLVVGHPVSVVPNCCSRSSLLTAVTRGMNSVHGRNVRIAVSSAGVRGGSFL